MKVAMIGTGYVGLVSGACFADFGHVVTCIDKDADKVERLRSGGIPIYEPGLDMLVAQNVRAGRLSFDTDAAAAVRAADAVFIAVGTPSRRNSGLETTAKSALGLRLRMMRSISSPVPTGTVDLVTTTVKPSIRPAISSAAE
jgi:nucleotide sugar dehydrogenase